MPESGQARALYERLSTNRRPYLRRAADASKLTIPSLIPPEGHTPGEDLFDPAQSIGAHAVNSLSSKLLLALLPTSNPFFRLRPDNEVQLLLDEDPDLELEVSRALAVFEKSVMQDIDEKGDRVVVFEMLKHLIVGGNVLVMDDPDSGLKLFHLSKYVVERDAFGTPIRIVVREVYDPQTLPAAARDLEELQPALASADAPGADPNGSSKIEIYTVIALMDRRYHVWQELASGQEIPESRGSYPQDRLPWHALRMIRIDGENYGRGTVEEYLGDLDTLERLSRALRDGSEAAARVLFFVPPNSSTSLRTLATARNGSINAGNADEVGVVQLNKFNDFSVAANTAREIESRLMSAFLMNTSVRRDAERVTAQEIRFVAEELEQGLGGIYSLLTQEFQLPYVRRRIRLLEQRGAVPSLPDRAVTPTIITGLEALGRGRDRERLLRYGETITATLGPDEFRRIMNTEAWASRLALADGIDTSDLFKTPDQMAAEAQQGQQQALLQRAAPQLVGAAGDLVTAGAQPGPQEELAQTQEAAL